MLLLAGLMIKGVTQLPPIVSGSTLEKVVPPLVDFLNPPSWIALYKILELV